MIIVVTDALSRTAEQSQIIWLTGMVDRMRIVEGGAVFGNTIDEWGIGVVDYLRVGVIFQYDQHDMVNLKFASL
jgi:hypothetical protein